MNNKSARGGQILILNKGKFASKIEFTTLYKPKGKVIHLDGLFTGEKYRGEKFVQQIFAEVEQIAKEKGAQKLSLNALTKNNDAIQIYKRYGFKINSEKGVSDIKYYRMKKQL